MYFCISLFLYFCTSVFQYFNLDIPSQAETIHDPEYLAAQELARAAEERESGENTGEAEQQDEENMDVDPPALPVKFPALTPQAAPKTGVTCLPQRAALLKSMLNFLKKAIQVNSLSNLICSRTLIQSNVLQDPAFSASIRHVMDGSLPNSLKHIISNAEYYGPRYCPHSSD